MKSKLSVDISSRKTFRCKLMWRLFCIIIFINRKYGEKFADWLLEDIKGNFDRYFKIEIKS